MEDGERSCTDSDDGSSASWVILNDDERLDEEPDDPLAPTEEEPAAAAPAAADPGPPGQSEAEMHSSGDSTQTVIRGNDGSDVEVTTEAAPMGGARVEEGSDIEVIAGEQLEDVYFQGDSTSPPPDVSDNASGGGGGTADSAECVASDTGLRQRRPGGGDGDGGRLERAAPAYREERDRWADDTDLSSLTDQMVLDVSTTGRLRQYVHQRNNTVNHVLTVLLVLCVTCVIGLGMGHFLGWLHHHEMTEEMVQSLDEKLDVLRDDLMTCMTTEDDQDLDNKWIKELLTENEALMHQLHHEHADDAEAVPQCSEAGYARLRDQVNQLRMENDELKASIAKMRYGIASQDGYVLRRHRNQINQLVTENGELARELRRTRYLQPPADLTGQEDPAPPAGQPSPDSAVTSDSFDSSVDSGDASHPADSDSPDLVFDTDSDADSADSGSDSADSDSDPGGTDSDSAYSDSSADEGVLAALLSWRPSADSAPLQEARRHLWALWQEASDFSRAEPVSKYVKMAGKSLAKVEKTLLKAVEKVQEFGQEVMEDDGQGGGGVEKVAGKLGRKVDKVIAKLDARWQQIRRNWGDRVAAREAEQKPIEEEAAPAPAGPPPPPPPPPNHTDPSLAAFYARRSRHRQHARSDDEENWQMGRATSRAALRGAYHDGSWLLKRAQARQQLRSRRGEEGALPRDEQRWRRERPRRRGDGDEPTWSDGRWRQERQHSRGEWQTLDDDDDHDADDDDDDDYEDHAARMARHMEANARFRERIQKTVQHHADKINRKVRENHWKHFGGRNRHEFRQHFHKY